MTFTIAIDGPAAAGKGTLSRRIAEEYGFHHLDTGLTYRATAKALLDRGLPLDDEAVAADVAKNLDLGGLDRSVLSAHAIGEAASKIAVRPSVRRARVEAQRGFAAREPGTVLDGRDIGGDRLIIKRQAAIEQRFGRGAIGQARIEMMEAVFLRDPAGKRALAGGGGTVDGDGEGHQAALVS